MSCFDGLQFHSQINRADDLFGVVLWYLTVLSEISLPVFTMSPRSLPSHLFEQ